MSKETRTIRPFKTLGSIGEAFQGIVLHHGQDACQPEGTIVADISPHEYLLRPVSLQWSEDEAAFDTFKEKITAGVEEAGLPADAVAIVVVASTTFLKIADVVLFNSLTELSLLTRITDLTSPQRPRAFSAPFSGFSVDTYLLLSRSLSPQPLRPHIRGTWLARAQFRVETSLGPALLPPTPLTDAIRAELRLPAKTIRYLYFGDHDLLRPCADQEQPVFYVDENLLANLNARRRSPASKALQLQLAHDFVSAVVYRAASSEEIVRVGYEDVRSSLLGSALRIAAGSAGTQIDREELLKLVRTNPAYVVARAEHNIDLASGFKGIFEDQES